MTKTEEKLNEIATKLDKVIELLTTNTQSPTPSTPTITTQPVTPANEPLATPSIGSSL